MNGVYAWLYIALTAFWIAAVPVWQRWGDNLGVWLKNPRLAAVFGVIAAVVVVSAIIPDTRVLFWLSPLANGWTGEATRTLGLILGGLGAIYGIILAAWRTEAFTKQVEIGQRGQFNETLSRGLALLAHEEISMRTAGLRLLRELHKADDTSERQEMIREMLLDFVQQHAQPESRDRRKNKLRGSGEKDRRVDIETAIHILGDHTPKDRREDIDFSNLALHDLKLRGVCLFGANFDGANLDKAVLLGANLVGADLINVHLHDAHLNGANLTDASLSCAQLSRTYLTDTILDGADLTSANLYDVRNLTQSQLDTITYHPSFPPYSLPKGLKPPEVAPIDGQSV